ncbi:MAG: flavodoxin family protein [Patescibacteria group bacterium]
MKTLIVFYSRTGITKTVAQKIAEKLGADLEELIDLQDRSGVLGYLKSGRDAVNRKLSEIKPLEKNPTEYDLVIIGTPNWAGNMACAPRNYLTQTKGKIKNIAFFGTQGGTALNKPVINMAELSGLKSIADLVLTSKEVVKDNYQDKLEEFIKKLAV